MQFEQSAVDHLAEDCSCSTGMIVGMDQNHTEAQGLNCEHVWRHLQVICLSIDEIICILP